jgi:hypothetical protein
MLQSEVVIGGEYTTQWKYRESIRVKVISDRPTRNGHSIKYRVQCVDSGRELVRLDRTARALHPIEVKQ